MQKSVFEIKSQSMSDFYMYYTREGRNTFAVATIDLSNPYIKNHKKAHSLQSYNPKTHTRVFDWKSDRFITVPLSSIRKLVPLATVLKNDNRYNRV